jgi:hypothetical protein
MKINAGYEPDSNSGDRFFQRSNHRSHIPTEITSREFTLLLLRGHVVDGRAGGTILGRDAGEGGGSRLIFKIGSHFILQGFACGGNFIVNREASAMHQKRLQMINAGLTMNEKTPEGQIDEIGQLIVATAWPHDRLIWVDFGQTVITGEPALKHVIELGLINRSPNPRLVFDVYSAFHCDPGAEDGIV